MKYSIIGFAQEKLIEYNLNLTETLILKYIIDSLASPMQKYVEKVNDDTEIYYVWITRNKLLEDLPILDISETRLAHIFVELRKKDMIKSVTIANQNINGSKTYFTVTPKVYNMLYARCAKNDIYPCAKNDTSYISISISKDIDNTINSNTNVLLQPATQSAEPVLNNDECLSDTKQIIPKKDYKFESVSKACKKVIQEYTNDEKLQKKLEEYLDMRINMWVERPSMALTANRFRSLLKTLNAFDNKIDVINQSIEKHWATFYAVKSKGISSKPYEANISCVSYTKDEMKDIEKWRKDNNVPTF